jgi:hypothetical protein
MRWENPSLGTDGRIEDDETAEAYTRAGWDGDVPDPNDSATGGCLMELLGDWAGYVIYSRELSCWLDTYNGMSRASRHPTMGLACISHAKNRGQWR